MLEIIASLSAEWRKFSVFALLAVIIAWLSTKYLSEDIYLYQIEVGSVGDKFAHVNMALKANKASADELDTPLSGDSLKMQFLIELDKRVGSEPRDIETQGQIQVRKPLQPWVSEIKLSGVKQIKSVSVEELFHTFELRSSDPNLGVDFADYFLKTDDLVAERMVSGMLKLKETSVNTRIRGLEEMCGKILANQLQYPPKIDDAFADTWQTRTDMPPACQLSVAGVHLGASEQSYRDNLMNAFSSELDRLMKHSSQRGKIVELHCHSADCRIDLGKPFTRNVLAALLLGWLCLSLWIITIRSQ